MKNVRELAQEVVDLHSDQIGTHYVGCWRYHVACFAVLVRDVLEDESAETGYDVGEILRRHEQSLGGIPHEDHYGNCRRCRFPWPCPAAMLGGPGQQG